MEDLKKLKEDVERIKKMQEILLKLEFDFSEDMEGSCERLLKSFCSLEEIRAGLEDVKLFVSGVESHFRFLRKLGRKLPHILLTRKNGKVYLKLSEMTQ